MRKAFNFYKSFYDVYKELNNSEKIQFMDALLDRQFTGAHPKNLKGMAKFAYKSQEQVINQQIEGWESKTGEILTLGACQGGYVRGVKNPTEAPSVQEKEKGQEKGQEKVPPLVDFLNHAQQKSKDLNLNYEKSKVQVKYEGWVSAGWKDGHGKKILNWKSKINNTLPHILKEKKGNDNKTSPHQMYTL